MAEKREIKLSHLVSKALADEIRKNKEESLLDTINKIFDDPGVAEEQRLMAQGISDSTDVEELPW